MSRAHDRTHAALTMRAQSKRYFAALGEHVAQIRKTQGYKQAELAKRLGVSQQAMFAYELGERRISVLILNELASIFGIGLDELARLAEPLRQRKHRLSQRALRHAERLQALSKTQQRFVIKIIDILEGNGVGERGPKAIAISGRTQ